MSFIKQARPLSSLTFLNPNFSNCFIVSGSEHLINALPLSIPFYPLLRQNEFPTGQVIPRGIASSNYNSPMVTIGVMCYYLFLLRSPSVVTSVSSKGGLPCPPSSSVTSVTSFPELVKLELSG